MAFSVFALVNGNLNHNGNGGCISPINNLPHCIGYQAGEIHDGFETPCYRGANTLIILSVFYVSTMAIPPILVIISMTMIYRSIVILENRMSKFSAASFRARIQERENSAISDGNQQASSNFLKKSFAPVITLVKKWIFCQKDPMKFPNKVLVERSTIMNKALAYFVSFSITVSMWLLSTIHHYLLKKERSYVLFCITNFFASLQGLYNLIIYSHPKAMNTMSAEKVGYWQAFVRVVTYKHGENKSRKSHRDSTLALTGQFNGRLKMKSEKSSKQLLKEVNEEEKCEIQPFEEEIQMPSEMDQYFSDSNPSMIDNNLFPMSTETSHRSKPAHNIHSNSLDGIDEEEGRSSESLGTPSSTDVYLPTQKLEEEIRVGDTVVGKVEIRRSSIGF